MEHISESIYIGREAYLYIRNEMRKQYGYKPLTEEQKDRIWRRLYKGAKGDEVVRIDKAGGWSVYDVKQMLDKAGFEYEAGEEVRYIDAY